MFKIFVLFAVLVTYEVNCGYHSGYGGHTINAAVKSSHSVETRPVNIHSQAPNPVTVKVRSQPVPLTLHFKTESSPLKVLQTHKPGYGGKQSSSSKDPPHKLFHVVKKPVHQEVREIIQPYRNVIQEVRPVKENIRTIVAKGGYGGGGGGGGHGGWRHY